GAATRACARSRRQPGYAGLGSGRAAPPSFRIRSRAAALHSRPSALTDRAAGPRSLALHVRQLAARPGRFRQVSDLRAVAAIESAERSARRQSMAQPGVIRAAGMGIALDRLRAKLSARPVLDLVGKKADLNATHRDAHNPRKISLIRIIERTRMPTLRHTKNGSARAVQAPPAIASSATNVRSGETGRE